MKRKTNEYGFVNSNEEYEVRYAKNKQREGYKGRKYAGGGGASGSPEIHILNEGEKFDKSRYKAVFGDFDKDGIENLDDPNPTKKGDTKSVEERRITDSIAQLLDIKNDLDSTMYTAVGDIAKLSPKDAVIYARTKTPYSIIQKLIGKRLLTPKDPKKGLTDLIGMTIAVDNFADLTKLRKVIESGKVFNVYEVEDFYKNPLDGYMAVHYILLFKDDRGTFPVELQLKTKRMKAVNEVSHKAYAQHNLNRDELLKVTSIVEKADKGNATAIKQYNALISDKAKLEDSFFKDKAKKYSGGGNIEIGTNVFAYFYENYMGAQLVESPAMGDPVDGRITDIIQENGKKKYVIKFENGETKKLSESMFEDYITVPKYAKGGDVEVEEWSEIGKENNRMLRNQVREVAHHSDEINSTVGKNTKVEPWVVAKMERASTDLSDVTHYLDGEKYAGGGDIDTKDFTNLPLGTRINAYHERRDKDLKGNIIEKTPNGYKIETREYNSYPVTYDMITRVMSFPPKPEAQPRKKFLGLFAGGGPTDMPSDNEIRSMIKSFISKFPTDATSYSQSTDEIVDLAYNMQILLYEQEDKEWTSAANKPFLKAKYDMKPGERNAWYRNKINLALKKLNSSNLNELYQDYKDWFNNEENTMFAGGGLVFTDKADGTKYSVEKNSKGQWTVFSEGTRWKKRDEFESGLASKEDAVMLAKVMANVIDEFSPETNVSSKFAPGGSTELPNNQSLLYFLQNEASSGMIASRTNYDQYYDIDKIRHIAIHILQREGDRKYTMQSFQEILNEASDENESNPDIMGLETMRYGGDVVRHFRMPRKRFVDGGPVGADSDMTEVQKFFFNLNYDLLPPAFFDYVKNEILNDPELAYLSANEPIFITIKEKVNALLNKDEMTVQVEETTDSNTETQEAIDLLMELSEDQEGAEKRETLEAVELLKELLV